MYRIRLDPEHRFLFPLKKSGFCRDEEITKQTITAIITKGTIQVALLNNQRKRNYDTAPSFLW